MSWKEEVRDWLKEHFLAPNTASVRFTPAEADDVWERFGDRRMRPRPELRGEFYMDAREIIVGDYKLFKNRRHAHSFAMAINHACAKLPYKASIRKTSFGKYKVTKIADKPNEKTERFLRSKLPAPLNDLKQQAKVRGIKWRTLKRTADLLEVKSSATGYGKEHTAIWRFEK